MTDAIDNSKKLHPSSDPELHHEFLMQQNRLLMEGRARILEERGLARKAAFPDGYPDDPTPEQRELSDRILADADEKLAGLERKHTPPWDDGDY